MAPKICLSFAWLFLGTVASSSRILGLVMNSPSSASNTYPLARRALIEKAKAIDPTFAKGSRKGSYSSVGWSNRLGTVLTPVSENVYTADRPFIWNRIDVGCRMTVVQLLRSQQTTSNKKDQGRPSLFVHSPVSLDPPLIEALSELGDVEHVVSPNYEHVKFAKAWGEHYPHAKMWACPGMMEREPQVRWTGELPSGIRPPGFRGSSSPFPGEPSSPPLWDLDVVQPLHFDCEVNPFTGTPFFNEVVFFHAPSETLMVTDTYWNYPRGDGETNANYATLPGGSKRSSGEDDDADYGVWELAPDVGSVPLGSQLWKGGMDKVFRPFYLNLMVKPDKREVFRSVVDHIVNEWEPDTLIPAHGDVVRGKTLIREVLTDHFNV